MFTLSSIETTSGIVFEEGKPVPVDLGRKQWGNEEGSPLIAMLQEKTLQTGTYAVNKEELGWCVFLTFSTVTVLETGCLR